MKTRNPRGGNHAPISLSSASANLKPAGTCWGGNSGENQIEFLLVGERQARGAKDPGRRRVRHGVVAQQAPNLVTALVAGGVQRQQPQQAAGDQRDTVGPAARELVRERAGEPLAEYRKQLG